MALRDIEANGMTFRCRESGAGGEPVILLHGFPETSHMWTEVMTQLADAGYHCLAPDQRGYSPGARPVGVEAYTYEHLAADVLALADAWGVDRFHLAGHDWGALVGWYIVSHDAAPRIASWSALSIPHPRGFAEGIRDDPEEEPYRQFLTLAMMDGVPEQAMGANDLAVLRAAAWSASSPEQLAEYVTTFSQPEAMTAALHWYRASRIHERALVDGAFPDVTLPSQLIWGTDDAYVKRMGVDLGAAHMTGEYRVVELAASHWLTEEQPAAISDALIEHLRAHPL